MKTDVCRCVSRGLAALAFFSLALMPRQADAAPVLADATLSPTECLGSTACSSFTINPSSGVPLTGSFGSDADIALFQFVVTAPILFSAQTTSYGTGGFDPLFGLFYGFDSDATLAGRVVTYNGTAGDGPYPAISSNIIGDGEEFDLDDVLTDPLVAPNILLGEGSYILALLWGGQLFGTATFEIDGLSQEVPFLGSPLQSNDFGSRGCTDELSCQFSLSLSATPDVTPVPETGTLSLLAVGAVAAAIRQRRRNKSRH